MAKFQSPRGTRDFFGEEMIKRNYVLDKLKKVFTLYGYEELGTPAIEKFALLAAKGGGGEEVKKELYYFKDQGGRELGLRYDLTAPLARVVASNPNLIKPYKRQATGRVWRYDRPQAARWREFWQSDPDIIGSDKPDADAEIIAITCACFKELGFKDYKIKINNRKLLEGIAIASGIQKDKALDVFRTIDKLEKIGKDGVEKEFEEKGIDTKKFLNIVLGKAEIDKIEKIVKGIKIGEEGLVELKTVLEKMGFYGFKENVVWDPSLARGLDYYTGMVFETIIKGGKWSVAGGGRYDKLVELYGGKPTPGTGISFGVERIIEIMEERDLFDLEKTTTKVYVAPVNDKVRNNSIKIAQKLRNNGIPTETDLMGRNLRKQFNYANTRKIPFVVIVGEKEVKKGQVTLRNMKSGEQKLIKIENIKKYIG